jgi:ATP-dependent RNA helicase DeaD
MTTIDQFEAMGLSEETMSAIKKSGFVAPTTIQAQTIPAMLDWYDIIAKAPTGTGKTLAFGIPIIEHMERDYTGPQALILAPTRELVLQIVEEFRNLTAFQPHIRTIAIYGGQSIEKQNEELRKNPQIIVATPGRLIDHLRRHSIRLDTIHTAVLDEADRMLDMGFIRDVRRILDLMPKADQVAMFSATLSRAVMDISWIYQHDPVEVTVIEDEENKPPITQYSIEIGGHARVDAIARIIKQEKYEKVIVFCNMKHIVQGVTRRLVQAGCKADCIHGDVAQATREKVLVATDVAARGIDIFGVDAVFNYDIPNENENYIHRIGRTGRAHHTGVAYTFFTFMDKTKIDEIVRLTKTPMTPLDLKGPDAE